MTDSLRVQMCILLIRMLAMNKFCITCVLRKNKMWYFCRFLYFISYTSSSCLFK